MGTELLFHPDHIAPCILFETGGMEVRHGFVAEMFMEGDACGVGISDAGTEITDILSRQ